MWSFYISQQNYNQNTNQYALVLLALHVLPKQAISISFVVILQNET